MESKYESFEELLENVENISEDELPSILQGLTPEERQKLSLALARVNGLRLFGVAEKDAKEKMKFRRN